MTAVTKADFSPLTIMVIDDSPFMQMLLAEMLLSFGVGKVLTAAGAEEAFQRMETRRAGRDLLRLADVSGRRADHVAPPAPA